MSLAALLAAAALTVPPAGTAVRRGAITPEVRCDADPRFSYALFVPAAYDPARAWPILFVFDPRGRGAEAAEVFREAAAAHGVLIASSNDTMSDDPKAPNAAAVTAVWNDAQARLAVDPERRYAAGFSGTGRLAVRLGLRQPGTLAGVIAAGSRLQMDLTKEPWPFAFFGAAGDSDFNQPEMWRLHERLAANGTRERFAGFSGGHEWMPPALALEALDWLAIRSGTAGADVLGRYRAAAGARAAALEKDGRAGEALLVWEALAVDGDATAAAEIQRLGPDGRRERDRFRKQVERDGEWISERNRSMDILGEDPPPPLRRLLRVFQADPLAKQAASPDRVAALSAARRRNAVATNAGFYLAERYKADGRLLNALRAYELATAVAPERPGPHLGIARVEARRGNRKVALDALRAAVALGLRVPRHVIAEDPELGPLAADPAFAAILAPLPD